MKTMLRWMMVVALMAPMAAWADAPEDAPVAALDDALIASMKAGSANQTFDQRYAALDPVVMQSFSMPVIVQNSVGFSWPTIPAGQQQQISQLFEQFTVDSYVTEFNSYSGQQIKILPSERSLGPKKIVETQIVPGDGSQPTEIDYVVTPGDSGWQITDVLLNGTISQVAIHASDFSSLVDSGDASQLIAALKAKVAALSSGTAASGQ